MLLDGSILSLIIGITVIIVFFFFNKKKKEIERDFDEEKRFSSTKPATKPTIRNGKLITDSKETSVSHHGKVSLITTSDKTLHLESEDDIEEENEDEPTFENVKSSAKRSNHKNRNTPTKKRREGDDNLENDEELENLKKEILTGQRNPMDESESGKEDTEEEKEEKVIDHSSWGYKVQDHMSTLMEILHYKEVGERKNPKRNYFLYNDPVAPWKRFHYRSFLAYDQSELQSLIYFGENLLGPGTVHGGALLSICMEQMELFVKETILTTNDDDDDDVPLSICLTKFHGYYVEMVPLNETYIVAVNFEEEKDGGVHCIRAELKSLDEKKTYFIANGEYTRSSSYVSLHQQLQLQQEQEQKEREEEEEENEVEGLVEMKEVFEDLLSKGFSFNKDWRQQHKVLKDNHMLIFNNGQNTKKMSDFFNLKVFTKKIDDEAQFLIFFGELTEGRYRNIVHFGAIASILDALSGLTCILLGFERTVTNTLAVTYLSHEISECIRTLKGYRMVVNQKVLKKDVIYEDNKKVTRSKIRLTSKVQSLDQQKTYVIFSGIFIDKKLNN